MKKDIKNFGITLMWVSLIAFVIGSVSIITWMVFNMIWNYFDNVYFELVAIFIYIVLLFTILIFTADKL